MLRLRGITIDGSDPEDLAGFWRTALAYQPRSLWKPYTGGKDPHGHDPHLTFQHAADVRANHLHLDLYADDPDAEADRLVRLGAQRLRRLEEGDTWWWVLCDPEGNEFCVIAAQGQDRFL